MLALHSRENTANNNNNNNNINDVDDRCNSYFLGISTCEIVWLDYFSSKRDTKFPTCKFLKIGQYKTK